MNENMKDTIGTENEEIRKMIDSIEPEEGAKERMLANIRAKANAQMAKKSGEEDAEGKETEVKKAESTQPAEKKITGEKKTKVIPLSKIMSWGAAAAACLIIGIIGVNVIPMILPGTDMGVTGSDPIQIGNPFEDVANAKVIEDRLGISIDAPAGAKQVSYHVIDGKMADVIFTVNGHEYDLRASEQSGDISGIYGIEADVVQIDSETNAILTVLRDEEEIYTKIEWTDGKINYVVSNTDRAEKEELIAVYGQVK